MVAQLRKWGFLGSPRRFLILHGDRTEERPVFSYLQAGFFTLFQPNSSEILLKEYGFSAFKGNSPLNLPINPSKIRKLPWSRLGVFLFFSGAGKPQKAGDFLISFS